MSSRFSRIALDRAPARNGIVLAAALALAACGGGGSEEPAATTTALQATAAAAMPTVPAATSSPAPTTAPAVPDGDSPASSPDASDGSAFPEIKTIAASSVANGATSTVILRVRATLLDNVGARVELIVNGKAVASTEVRSTSYQNVTLTVPAVPAGSSVDVLYDNDGSSGGVDRNLWIQSITVDGQTIASTDPTTVYDRGLGAAALDGVDTRPGQEGMFWNGAMRFRLAGPAPVAGSVTGSGFYIDQVAGSDTNTGLSASSPWRSISKLAAVRLSPGQGVYLRCGQTWRTSLVLNATQLADGATVAGYGSECATNKATLSGADLFNGNWSKSGNVWTRSVSTTTPRIARLFVGRTSQLEARWPNATASTQGLALAGAQVGSGRTALRLSAADANTLRGRDLVGATVQIRTMAWRIEAFTVTSFDSANGILNLNRSSEYPITQGAGFVLQGKSWMLDSAGEYFHDVAGGKLLVYPSDPVAQANLNTATVEGSVRDTVLHLSQRANLRVYDIAARLSRVDGIVLQDAPGAIVERVEASGNADSGIVATLDATKAGPTIRNSRVSDNWHYGIDARFSGRAVIADNTVLDTGTVTSTQWSDGAIVAGDGARITGNTVDGSAYHGIRFSGAGGSVIANNTVTNYCLRLSDCGGIYTWNGAKATGPTQTSTVENNLVLPAAANLEGAVGPGVDVVTGIFLDDFTSGATVRGNTVHGMPYGIGLRNGRFNLIENNRVWLPAKAALTVTMDQGDQDWLVGNTFRGNQFVPVKTAIDRAPALPDFTESYPIWFFNDLSGSASISSGSNVFAQNQVVRLDGSMDGVHAWIRSRTQDVRMSSASWASFNPADAPTATPLTFALYSLMLGSELVGDSGFDGGLANWTTYFARGMGGSAQALGSSGGCTGPCARLTVGQYGDYLASRPLSLRAGATYVYSYTAVLGGTATLPFPYIGRDGPPYDSMATGAFSSQSPLSGVAGQTIRYEGFFTAKAADPARVYVQVKTPGVPVVFDNVSVRELNGYSFAKTADFAQVAHAPTGTPRVVSCSTLGWDAACTATTITGAPVTLPTTLPAGSAQLFLRSNSPWRR